MNQWKSLHMKCRMLINGLEFTDNNKDFWNLDFY
jgi:hypothetical protein